MCRKFLKNITTYAKNDPTYFALLFLHSEETRISSENVFSNLRMDNAKIFLKEIFIQNMDYVKLFKQLVQLSEIASYDLIRS